MAIFSAVPPHSSVHSAVTPLASALASHSPHLPFTLVLPALLLANEHASASLVPIFILTVIQISIGKLSDSVAIRNVVFEVAIVEFAL